MGVPFGREGGRGTELHEPSRAEIIVDEPDEAEM